MTQAQGWASSLAHLAKGHVNFCHLLASVVRRKLSHLNLLLWNPWTKIQIKPNLAGMGLGWVPFKILSDRPALHSRWLLLLKIEISSIVHCYFIIPSPTKLRRDIVMLPSVLPSVHPSFRNILVNTLESTFFNGFWPNLVHTHSLRESGTLLIFKVIDQRSRSPGQIFRQKDTPRFALPLL